VLQVNPQVGVLPVQVGVEPVGPAAQAVQDVPQVWTLVLLAQVSPQRWYPLLQLIPHCPFRQVAIPFPPVGAGQLAAEVQLGPSGAASTGLSVGKSIAASTLVPPVPA
jgi:hypothetical protein